MIIILLRLVSFLFWICFYIDDVFGDPYFRCIRNAAFDSRKVLENKITTTHAASVMICSNLCAAEPTCLSLNYNKQSGTCVLFGSDFTDVASTATKAEEGWLYYYFIRDYDKSLRYRCVSTAPTSDICSVFCLHYFYDDTASYADFTSMCSQLDGGEMVKVDRGLKQHCVENLLADKLNGDVFIQGTTDGLTATWRYDDSSVVTYFNWNTAGGQPEVKTSEPYMALRKTEGYRWHDTPGRRDNAVVCQQS